MSGLPVGVVAVVVSEMLETALFASAAGIGFAVIFSLAIVGVTKSADYARSDRRSAAVAAAVMGGLALLICIVGVVLGLYVMASD